MRKLLTALAATSLIGSLFLAAPAPVAANPATTWKVNKATGEDSIIHYDVSRDTLGKTQTYAAPAGSVLEMNLYLENESVLDLNDTVTLTLTNAQFTDTTAVNYGDSEGPADDTDCVIDWNPDSIGGASGGVLVAAVGCDTDATGDDYFTTVAFEITLAAAGTSAVLEVSGAGDTGKVYFFGTEANDEIYVSSGTLGSVATPADGTCADPDFSTDNGAQGSIQEALFAAFAAVDGNDDTIILCDGTYTYGADFEAYEGTDLYDGEINLVAETAGDAILDGNENSQIIFAYDVDLAITGVVFVDGQTSGNGGAIELISGDLEIFNAGFGDNYADDRGGAIYARYGDVNITDSDFTGNEADDYDGGAIAVRNANIREAATSFTIQGSTFDENSAAEQGGAVFSDHNVLLTIEDSTFTDNTAEIDDGGAVYAKDDATIGFSVFLRNESANDDGGAIYFDEKADINDSRFVDNFAAEEGGAVYAETSTFVDDTVFLRNRSLDWAGAISLRGNAWLNGAIFRANKSRRGGAIESWGDRLYLVESRFINNRATRDGGAIIRDGETLFGDVGPDTIFRGNQARLGDAVAIYRWKEVNGGPGREVARTWSRVWVAAGTTVWLVR